MMLIAISGVIAVISFVFSLSFSYFLIKKMINFKYGFDLHKKDKIKVPEMGGLSPLFTNSLLIPFLAPIFLTPIISSGIIGIIDDIAKLSPKEKLMLLFISGLFVGGVFYEYGEINSLSYIIGIAVGITIFSNLTNMLAGFNGLEIGMGVISSIFFSLILFLKGHILEGMLCLIFSCSYLGLLVFNKYPAKVFPGDVGTLPIGAFLSTIAIVSNEVVPFIVIMLPYLLDASLKYYSAGVMSRDEHKPTTLGEDGRLYYAGGYLSLPRFILKYKPIKEPELVLIIWIVGIICGIFGILVSMFL
ncbi:glycosyl transferase [Methanocaldococcus sp.]